MSKKFISVQSRRIIHRLYETDIKKIFYFKIKTFPKIPYYD